MKKILVAEDDVFLIKVYQSKLSKAGFEVRVAKDGEEVFTVLADFSPDLILLDIIMPKKDGFTVLQQLKANPSYVGIPVIVTSNLGQPEDKKRAQEMGAADYLVKSDIQISEIIEKITKVVGV